MKRLAALAAIVSITAVSLVVPVNAQEPGPGPDDHGNPHAMAPNEGPSHHRDAERRGQPDRPAAGPQRQAHEWHSGDRFERRHAPHYARIDHADRYGLEPPPPGHAWVRSGADALLISLSNNIIVSITSGAFR